jgi:cytoskeleton protein RodZ
MMVEDQLNNSNELGELLIRAREKLSLSQKDIATRLNLKEEYIVALDADDFDKLPAPTYVRGYIRSYARVVNLNADSLINLYEGIAEAPPEILPDVKPVVQASSRDKPVKAMTYLVTFTLVFLLIAWWQGQNIVNPGFFSFNMKTSEGGRYPGGFTYTYDVVNHAEILEVSDLDELEQDKLTNMKIVDLDEFDDTESDDILSVEDSLILNAKTSLTTPANPNAPTGSDTLKLELTAESWVEVFDASGERLYRALAKPGEIISITGTAPLSVKLGNARAVSVNFNGNAFDTSEYTKAGVARFLLE